MDTLNAFGAILTFAIGMETRLRDYYTSAGDAARAADADKRRVNLERVRRIKSRMVRLKTRGETIREVLEKYLDDDSDMKDMNLSAKCAPL